MKKITAIALALIMLFLFMSVPFGASDSEIISTRSAEDYYRYEIKNEDGSREVILVGGTPDNYGWWGLLFDADGQYYWNHGNIPESISDPVWQYKGCFDEGVPCGNPEYDDRLEQKK